MSQYNDIAGSDDIISLNYESQETFNEQSYRNKQSANRINKNISSKDQAKENQKPIEQVNDDASDDMHTDAQNYSFPTVNNEVSAEQPPTSVDTQNILTSTSPFTIPLPLVQSTLTDESSISVEKIDSLSVKSPIHEETSIVTESTTKLKLDSNTSGLDATTTSNNIRLYISPSTSLLETTNVDDAQPNPDNTSTTEAVEKNQEIELNDKPKEEPMDTSDAQASLGSDGIIESHPTSALIIESASVSEKSTKAQSPIQSKISISPSSKTLYALSQPTTNKFEAILAKLTTSPSRQVTPTVVNKIDSTVTIREEEELFIKESISKTVRCYAVKVDQNGRTLSRDLLNERIVEENITTRIESWPPTEKIVRRSITKTTRPTEAVARKKPAKPKSPKRKTKSLKPTSTVVSPKTSKAVQSDNDEVSKSNRNEDSSDDDDNGKKDNEPTDDISGDEFIPTPPNSAGQSLTKGLRVFAKWVDGHFYPGIIGSIIKGEKYGIEFDDGAKRYVKAHEIICQSYLEPNQNVRAENQDGHFNRGIIKRLIKKKKTGNLGYIVEKDGKEKWYPLRFVSLTHEQAEHLPTVNNNNNTEESTNLAQGKRKRTSNVPQSPNKKTRSSAFISPNKNTKSSISPNKSQRTTYTPTRQAKLFNAMYFLFTGFNDSIDVRYQIQDLIESHGGRTLEKMPNNNRRDNVYLISDIPRKTAKFFDAKKFNIPCVNYKWINESIEKGEIQDWEPHKLVLPEKETKKNNKKIDGDEED